MDCYYGTGGGGCRTSKTNQSLASSGSGSGSWPDPLTLARSLITSPTPPAAFLNPAFDACASSPTSDVDPTLLRLTRSRLLRFSSSLPSSTSSDQSTAARRLLQMNTAVYKTPVKMVDLEEDVLVIDGVLVSDSRSNSKRNNSSGSPPNSSGSGAFYKTELCRSWEELRVCLYGSKCHVILACSQGDTCTFAHGKEELRCDLRGPRSWKLKNEVRGAFATKSVPSAEWGTIGSELHRYVSLPEPNTSDSDFKGKTTAKLAEVVPVSSPASSKPSSSTFTWPPTEEEDALISQVLYGPSSHRRLPVFEQLCPQITQHIADLVVDMGRLDGKQLTVIV